MVHHEINTDNDLVDIFCNPPRLNVGDSISINYNNIAVQDDKVSNISLGHDGQAYVIELDSDVCLQRYSMHDQGRDLFIIFKDSSLCPTEKIMHAILLPDGV